MGFPKVILSGALALSASTALPAQASTVAMLPFWNLSGAEPAREAAGDLVQAALQTKGYAVVRGERVERILEAERARYLDSLPEKARTRLFQELGVDLVASGAVYSFAEGENPIVALSVRLIRQDGTTFFWNVSGLSAGETEGIFGLRRAGSVDALAREVTLRCLRDLPPPGGAAKPSKAPGKPFGRSGPVTFRAKALERGHRYRICLLPFENYTSAHEAPQELSLLLWRRLVETDSFEVVEPADFRDAMVKEVVRSFRDMDPEKLRKLGERFHTDLFLRGSIYTYRDASPHGAAVSPEISIELALVDVSQSRILWTSQHSRVGSEYQSLLERGAISNVISLTDRVLSEMVDAEGKEEGKSPSRSLKSSRAEPEGSKEKGPGAP